MFRTLCWWLLIAIAGLGSSLPARTDPLCPGAGRALVELGFPDALVAEAPSTQVRSMRSGDRRWIRADTAGDGVLASVRSAQPAARGVDLGGQFVGFEIRLTGSGRLGGMDLRLGSGESFEDYYLFSLPLYDDPLFDPVQPGEWIPITMSFARAQVVGEPDRGAIRWVSWALRDAGTEPLRVEWRALEAWPEPKRGVVSFTFDDGYDEHFAAARAMARHGFAGTAYVMPDQIGAPGYLTAHQLEVLEREYHWDVAAHHATPLTDFANGELEITLASVYEYLAERGFRGAGHLAYPLGRHDPHHVVPATRRFFETARVASAGPETLPPADRYRLRAVNVLGTRTTPEELAVLARAALEHKHWTILMFHYLVEGRPGSDLEYNSAEFERALGLIRATGVEVRTVSEVWTALGCR